MNLIAGQSAKRSFYIFGVHLPINEHRIAQQRTVEGGGCLDSFDVKLVQRSTHARDRFDAGRLMHDQLADHRIVVGGTT